MTPSFWFWLIYFLSLVGVGFGLWEPAPGPYPWRRWPGILLLYLLLALLGYKVFGRPIQ